MLVVKCCWRCHYLQLEAICDFVTLDSSLQNCLLSLTCISCPSPFVSRTRPWQADVSKVAVKSSKLSVAGSPLGRFSRAQGRWSKYCLSLRQLHGRNHGRGAMWVIWRVVCVFFKRWRQVEELVRTSRCLCELLTCMRHEEAHPTDLFQAWRSSGSTEHCMMFTFVEMGRTTGLVLNSLPLIRFLKKQVLWFYTSYEDLLFQSLFRLSNCVIPPHWSWLSFFLLSM